MEVYSPEKGQEIYDQNATAKGPNLKIGNNTELAKFIEKRIKEHKSPAAVSQNTRESGKFDIELHWKTIYNYIDKEILDLDREDIPHGNYKTGKDRPEEANTR